ncbi:MAG: IPTL-CTERM sorting domain-containing protein, partial [Acidobacteriota bacterium]
AVTAATVEDLFPPELTCTWTCTAADGASCGATGLAIAEGSSQGSVEVSSDLADPDPSNDVALPVVTVGSLVEIPTLDFAGLAGLVLLLAAAGWVSLRRRSETR